MLRSKTRNSFSGIIVGPILVVFGTAALWKNEGRFDYHRAAKSTQAIASPANASSGQLISYTNSMDRGLTLSGEYVESMVGYLTVERVAEIYAWDRDKNDDAVTWTLRWMRSVEDNSRNSGVRQVLSSKRFVPPEYVVGELTIDTAKIEFVSAYVNISPTRLKLTDLALKKKLQKKGQYLHLSKHKPSNLGDERIRYDGIPVPHVVTYFGRYSQGQGTAHQAKLNNSYLDQWIQEIGVLHHVVGGDRETALAIMKAHLTQLKWAVRSTGIGCTIIGFLICLGSMTGFLYHIPALGALAQWGVFYVSVALGLTLASVTILASYFSHHPRAPIGLMAICVMFVFSAYKKAKASQQAMKRSVDQEYGREVDATELKELEFLELARLALSDTNLDGKEKKYLKSWAKRHKWDESKFDEMLTQANRSLDAPGEKTSSEHHLKNLVRLSLADGKLRSHELRSIQKAAQDLGYDRAAMKQLMKKVRQAATRATA